MNILTGIAMWLCVGKNLYSEVSPVPLGEIVGIGKKDGKMCYIVRDCAGYLDIWKMPIIKSGIFVGIFGHDNAMKVIKKRQPEKRVR